MERFVCEACGGLSCHSDGENGVICDFCGAHYKSKEPPKPKADPAMIEAQRTALFIEAGRYRQKNDHLNELDVLAKALALDKNNCDAWSQLGRCYRSLGLTDKALECCDKALEIDPNYMTAYGNIGAVYHVQGNFKKALEYYEKSLRSLSPQSPDYATLAANYALAQGKLGNKKEAIHWLKIAESKGYKNGETIKKQLKISNLEMKLYK